MPKENREYFSHDYNARGDRKIAPLTTKYKGVGYAVYWVTVEMLHEEGGAIDFDEITFQSIAKDLNEDAKTVSSILSDCIKSFKLFCLKNKKIVSSRVDENLELRKNISAQRSLAGKASAESKKKKKVYKSSSTDVEQPLTSVQQNSTDVEQPLTSVQQNSTNLNKGKERKGKEIKGKASLPINATQQEIKNAAVIVLKEYDLADWFIQQEAQKFSEKYLKQLPIRNLHQVIWAWLKQVDDDLPFNIWIGETKHEAKKINGNGGFAYPSVKFKCVDEKNKEVILLDDSRIKLKEGDIAAHKNGILTKDRFYKGMKY